MIPATVILYHYQQTEYFYVKIQLKSIHLDAEEIKGRLPVATLPIMPRSGRMNHTPKMRTLPTRI
jgi:hypothetical protein